LPGGIESSRICRKARDCIARNFHQQAAMSIPSEAAVSELMLTSAAPAIVLDTNVVLDWLLFNNPSVGRLAAAVKGQHVCWLATAAMRDELIHVLDCGLAAARQADTARLLATWDAHATIHTTAPPHRLVCTDPDDQKFIDLALASQARWLLSRDRAVLSLARRAAPLGLVIVVPERWSLPQ
jgi:putative PIN family toxin of toxin-antitoxin system